MALLDFLNKKKIRKTRKYCVTVEIDVEIPCSDCSSWGTQLPLAALEGLKQIIDDPVSCKVNVYDYEYDKSAEVNLESMEADY